MQTKELQNRNQSI